MKFGPLQLEYFGADEGAYSIVTQDERDKGQITLTEADGEAALAIKALGQQNIPRQAAKSQPLEIIVRRSDGTEQQAALTINFPKAERNELRIYRNSRQGFSYEAGDVWFVFRRGGNLVVGSLPEKSWRSLGREDSDDDIYVALAAEEPLILPVDPIRVSALQYQRDPAVARRRFKLADYRCEYNPKHELFVARATGKNFLEPHHLIMVSLQKRFPKCNLDVVDNIFALCPWCHRAVHHAERPLVTKIVTTLLERRSTVCERLSLSMDDVLRLYNCEQISKS